MKLKLFLILILFQSVQFSVLSCQTKSIHSPQYVWIDAKGEGRNVYAYFRNEFELSALPREASIKLYAKSNYNLFVNGQFVSFGPVRSYPEHPYYDSLNIAPYLKVGKNLIAVKVLSNGMHTYQVPDGTAGFIAWGELKNGTSSVNLQTPGSWVCRKSNGYSSLAPRFSFAQGAVEIYDALLEPDNWLADQIELKNWKKPTLLQNQQYFGTLVSRQIPMLTNTDISPKFAINRISYTTDELFYNWNSQDFISKKGSNLDVLMYSYIYSPSEQEVSMGFSWGKFWINGKLIEMQKVEEKAFRSNANVRLQKGWNTLFSHQEIIWNNLDGMLALPQNTDVQLSVRKKLNDTLRIAITEPMTKAEIEKTGIATKIPEVPEKMGLKWENVSGVEPYINPAKPLAWLDKKKSPIAAYQVQNIEVPASKNEAVVVDFGSMQLGRIYVDIDAPAGTIVDFTWSEDLKDSLVTLYKRMEANSIARFISTGGVQHLETFRPFGLRYLQVYVHNHKSTVKLHKIGVRSQVYPYDMKGSFACSDPFMNRIWELGKKTVQVCSEDTYTDTPFRERGHYVGDMFPEFGTTLAISGDSRLVKQTIRMFNQQYHEVYMENKESIHNDFPLINILIAHWYIRMFKDVEFAKEVYPLYSNYLNLKQQARTPNSFYKQDKVFLEWTQIDKRADLTAVQALIKADFDALSDMANWLGKMDEAKKYNEWSADLAQFISTQCWDAAAGNFIDGYNHGKLLTSRYPISSTMPSVWQITSKEQEVRIQKWFEESLINIGNEPRKQLTTTYGGFYALGSLYQQGNAALAENYIRKHWEKMVSEINDLTWEDFIQNSASTLSHAWASSPTYYLSSQVLGVDLGFPGTLSPDTIYIHPQAETIIWAKGVVPHPKGLVSVDWHTDGNLLFLNYTAPQGLPVMVAPKGKLAGYRLIVNSKF